MRRKLLRSVTAQALAWTAALSLGAPMAAAQSAGSLASVGAPGVGAPTGAETGAQTGAQAGTPLAGVSGIDEKECELITAQRGESAVLAEKTREKGERFLFLQGDEFMLEEFQVEDREECATLFGLFPGGGTQAAAAGAAAGAGFGGTLAGAGIGAAVGLGLGAAVIGGLVVTTVIGGPNQTVAPTSTIPQVNPQ